MFYIIFNGILINKCDSLEELQKKLANRESKYLGCIYSTTSLYEKILKNQNLTRDFNKGYTVVESKIGEDITKGRIIDIRMFDEPKKLINFRTKYETAQRPKQAGGRTHYTLHERIEHNLGYYQTAKLEGNVYDEEYNVEVKVPRVITKTRNSRYYGRRNKVENNWKEYSKARKQWGSHKNAHSATAHVNPKRMVIDDPEYYEEAYI